MQLLDRVNLETDGRIAIPNAVLAHYQITRDTPIRKVETSSRILLIPVTTEPVKEELREELEAWQSAVSSALQITFS
jgi:hypothetical protein